MIYRHTFRKHEPFGLVDCNQTMSHALKTSREKLPSGYKFGNLDRKIDMEDLYMLIRSHYLGSREENICLGYTREFLEWQLDALKDTPEYACVLKFKEGEDFPEKIVGFIYGREQSMMICGSEVKLLCIAYIVLLALLMLATDLLFKCTHLLLVLELFCLRIRYLVIHVG